MFFKRFQKGFIFMKAKYIPNILSVLRLFMSFAFAAVFIWGYPDYVMLSGVTDVVDGILARKFGWVTNAGKILDPLADKLMQCTALICLVFWEIVPWWILILIVVKELLMGCGAIVLFRKSHEIGVSKYFGKAYTVLFYAVIMLFLLFQDRLSVHEWATHALCIFMAAMAFCVLTLYYISYLKNKTKKRRKATTDGNVCKMP